MKYFLDTEFIERGLEYPIELISIGIVSEDGREFYAVGDWWVYAHANDWVQQHVIATLGNHTQSRRKDIVKGIRDFVGEDKPEFWGYYADYDWVVFAQLFGTMMDLPEGWPMYCRDIKQLCDWLGNPPLPKQCATEHNAINDARWNKFAYEFLVNRLNSGNYALARKLADVQCEIAAICAPVVVPDTLPRTSCNRHNDCRAADIAARARGATFGASHCHDECCEDCFGC